MDMLLALAALLLSLFGFDGPRSTFEAREVNDGRDLLHAAATLQAGVARLDCFASDTGLCYWSVARCTDASCTPARFALAVDDSRQLTGISQARLCVSGTARDATPACNVLKNAR